MAYKVFYHDGPMVAHAAGPAPNRLTEKFATWNEAMDRAVELRTSAQWHDITVHDATGAAVAGSMEIDEHQRHHLEGRAP